MDKKIKTILIGFCIVWAFGCIFYGYNKFIKNNIKNNYKISELVPHNLLATNYIDGSIIKVKDDNCGTIKIIIEYKSGNIKDNLAIVVTPQENNLVNILEAPEKVQNITNWEKYQLKVKKIICIEK